MTRISSKSVLIFSILGLSVLLAGFSFMPDVSAYQGKLVVEKPVYGLGGSPFENAVIHIILGDEDFENIAFVGVDIIHDGTFYGTLAPSIDSYFTDGKATLDVQLGTQFNGPGHYDLELWIKEGVIPPKIILDTAEFEMISGLTPSQNLDYEFSFVFGTADVPEGHSESPFGISIDSVGNIFVLDNPQSRVIKLDANGNFLQNWGSQGSADGQFYFPHAMGIDSSDNVYVGDGNGRIQKFDSNGNLLMKFGSNCNLSSNSNCVDPDGAGPLEIGDGQFRWPKGIEVDDFGNIFVLDSNKRVQKFDSNGNFLLKWGSEGTGPGQFSQPLDLAIDSKHNLYVSEGNEHRIQKFDSNGNFIFEFGELCVADSICWVDPDGSGPLDAGDGKFFWPYGIAVDSFDNLFVVDLNDRVQIFSSDGEFVTKFGATGSDPGYFSGPRKITLDSQDNLYIVEDGNDRGQVFTLLLDNISPIVSLTGSSSIDVVQNDIYFELSATCFDNIDGQINGNIVISGDTVDTTAEISTVFTIDYDCDDSVGNSATTVQRYVTVIHAPIKNLYVSAENSMFDNYMSGPQVIEVVIVDSAISATDEGRGEPDVTVNGKDLRMVQGIDGNWYGYFANLQSANAADATQAANSGKGLDFGVGCTASSATSVAGITLSDSRGVYFPNGLTSVTQIPGSLVDCSATSGTDNLLMHVVRESKTINPFVDTDTGTGNGQIGLADNMWPFIQLMDLNPTGNVVIQYNKGGGAQSTTLTFDTVDNYANLELDRNAFTRGAQVHLTMTDVLLNIDPTDEDSWSWGTNPTNFSVFYQLFDENGNVDADGTTGAVDLRPYIESDIFQDTFMFEDNGFLLIDLDTQSSGTEILRIIDNDDSQTNGAINIDASTVSTDGGSITAGNQPITFTELMPNSGIFSNTDESGVSNLIINPFAPRGHSATVDYNEAPLSVVVSFIPDFPLPLNIGDVSVDEDVGTVLIPVTWDPSDPAFTGLTTFTFALIPFDGTAVAGSDYTVQNIIIDNANPVTGIYKVGIQIIDDTIFESDETFTAILTDPNAEIAIIGTSTVTIIDNDPLEEFFSLSKNSDFSTEDREFETSDTIHILVFSPDVDTDNMKKAEFKIQDSKKVKLKGNLILGPDGIFTASVSLGDLNAGTAKVELKLEDDNRIKFNVKENIIILEPPSTITLPLTIGDVSVDEDVDVGYASIPVTWDPSHPAFVGLDKFTFAVRTSDGTAIEGNDYQSINYILISNPTLGIIQIAAYIIDDTTFESDETFTITLTDPNADDATIDTSTVTIIDNDPQPPVEEFFALSKNSDFSTEDREFETSDILYMLTTSNLVDYSNMKKAEFKIQDSKKVKLQGTLILGADGIFTSSVSLADLNPGTAKVELKLEDKNRNKFNVKENITIS